MKKRMLITTIVMMLVLAVALTSSSLAWFSANQATVKATGGEFTASAAGNSTNIGLATSGESTMWGSSAIMTNTVKTNLEPLVAKAVITEKTNAAYSDGEPVSLATLVNAESLNGARFLTDGSGAQVFPLDAANRPVQKSFASQANSVVYAKNLDTNGTQINSLKITLKLTGVSGEKDREGATVASPNFLIVLTNKGASEVLRTAVISKTGGYYVYSFPTEVQDTPISVSAAEAVSQTASAEITNEIGQSAEVSFTNLTWAAQIVYEIHVYAWYEGNTLDVTSQLCQHKYDLTLEAGRSA